MFSTFLWGGCAIPCMPRVGFGCLYRVEGCCEDGLICVGLITRNICLLLLC